MKGTIERYVDRVMAVADVRDMQRETSIRAELTDHLQEKVSSLEAEGYSQPEALVKAVEEHGNAIRIGYALRPWRFLDVRLQGTARGVIAIGPRAHGVVAIGGIAVGVVAFGGCAVGGVTFGGLALGLLLGWGGLATGAFAYGGIALGLVAFGGMAFGGIATGGTAAGAWVPGAGNAIWSYYTLETVPGWMRSIGASLSFDLRSPAQVRDFAAATQVWSMAAFSLLMLGLGAQTVFMRRETKRVNQIAGPTAE